jgi:hypothetical protein
VDEQANYVADLNDLVGSVASAQEALDNWDEGRTTVHGMIRFCDLELLEQELDEDLLALVLYVREHGDEIEQQIVSLKR